MNFIPKKPDIATLIIKHNNEETTIEEEKFLQDWIHESEENADCYKRLTDPESVIKQLGVFMKPDVGLARHNVEQKIAKRRIRRRNIRITTFAAAASLIGVVLYFTLWKEKPTVTGTTTIAKRTLKVPTTAPFGKALLVIDNEAVINLDSVKDGFIGKYGNVSIEKAKQAIRCKAMGNSPTGGSAYIKLITGAACQYHMSLPDNSEIDLSASSWARISSAPNAQERRLELAGQAYFNVMHDVKKTFFVTVGKAEIQVLGTQFNVNAYDPNGSIKTALVKGHVKIKCGIYEADLFHGQIATVIPGQLIKPQNANVNKEVEWKEGEFTFESDNISTIMDELSQWYNIEVKYIDKPIVSLTGSIARSTELNEVLNYINEFHKVKLTIDSVNKNRVIVSKWNDK